jgi:hypothetical protein
MLKKVRSKFVHAKVFLNRALSYASLVNMILILFLALSNLEKYGIDIVLERWLVPIFIFMFLFLIFLGYIEDKLGFFEEEQKVHAVRNPQLTEILTRLERIEKKLKADK